MQSKEGFANTPSPTSSHPLWLSIGNPAPIRSLPADRVARGGAGESGTSLKVVEAGGGWVVMDLLLLLMTALAEVLESKDVSEGIAKSEP